MTRTGTGRIPVSRQNNRWRSDCFTQYRPKFLKICFLSNYANSQKTKRIIYAKFRNFFLCCLLCDPGPQKSIFVNKEKLYFFDDCCIPLFTHFFAKIPWFDRDGSSTKNSLDPFPPCGPNPSFPFSFLVYKAS